MSGIAPLRNSAVGACRARARRHRDGRRAGRLPHAGRSGWSSASAPAGRPTSRRASSPTSSATGARAARGRGEQAGRGRHAGDQGRARRSRRTATRLLLCTHFEPINTAVYKNRRLQARRSRPDLAHRQILLRSRAVAIAIPADDFDRSSQYAKAHPGEVSYATIGAGSAQEIMARQLEKLAGISMNRIPFRGGPQVVQELIAGRVDFYVSPTLAIMPQYEGKQLKILAVSEPRAAQDRAGSPDAQGKGHRLRALRLARHLRRRRHAAADHRPAQPRHHVDCGDAGISGNDREGAGSIAISSTPAELAQVITQTLDDVAASIQEFGMQQEQ